jgi:hypothetical protein
MSLVARVIAEHPSATSGGGQGGDAVAMRARSGKRFGTQPRRSPWLGVVDAVVGCTLAATLVIVAAVFSAPVGVGELFAGFAVGIAIGATGQLPNAIRALRSSGGDHKAPAIAELRRQLAQLPETQHPLGY